MSKISRALIVVFLTSLMATTASAGDPCGDAETQVEMNTCAAELAKTAQKALDTVYADATLKVDGSWLEKLKAAQEAWRTYRDTQCTFEAAAYEGGSIQPMILSMCRARLTDQRSEELRTSMDVP